MNTYVYGSPVDFEYTAPRDTQSLEKHNEPFL